MTLDQLNTPFERRRVIEYGACGNKIVHHWYEVQNVIGTLYKSKEVKNQQGDVEFNLLIFFPGAKDGLLYERMAHPERYTVEQMAHALERYAYDSAFRMVCNCNERIKKGRFVGIAEIEFIRQFDPLAAERFAQHRLEFYARREEQERLERLARQEEDKAKEAKKQAEMDAIKARYLGWADQMTPLRFGKARIKMEEPVRLDNKIMLRYDFVICLVKDGWAPEKEEGVTTWYGSRWERKQSKPKTIYKLAKDNLYYAISKTEYDFAMYLSGHMDRL